jgi:hypothetical protein
MGLSWFPVAWADLNDGLVAHYPFNGNAQDATGNGNDGTVNGATLTVDRFGNADSAYSFDKNGKNYISVPDHQMLRPTQLTVATWVEPVSSAKWNTVLMKSTGGSWGGGYGITYYNTTEIGFYITQYNKNRLLGKIDLKKWSHIVGTFDGSTMKLYINGELVGPSSGIKINHSTAPLYFGKSSSAYYWDGKIDDIRIYNRALSEDEIKTLYGLTSHTGGHTVELKPGQFVMTINFGNAPTDLGGIGGIKWKDLNADGKRQPDEPGLPGVTIYLDLNKNGVLDVGEPRQVTDKSGNYKFLNLKAGTYVVREVVPDGYTQTFPN